MATGIVSLTLTNVTFPGSSMVITLDTSSEIDITSSNGFSIGTEATALATTFITLAPGRSTIGFASGATASGIIVLPISSSAAVPTITVDGFLQATNAVTATWSGNTTGPEVMSPGQALDLNGFGSSD